MKPKEETSKSNPFPGLRPFTPEESELFFGREKESEEVFSKLLRNRFITVTGASGSGKSSLVYCGILPKIIEMGRKESSPWRIITFRPGNDPFESLARAMHENIAETGLKEVSVETLLSDLYRESDGISTALKKHIIRGYEKVLLVIDQFEELFRYRTSDTGGTYGTDTGEFIENLVNAVSLIDSRVFTIVTMRADFMGECAYYQGLTQLINRSNFLIPRMERENYRQVIEGPAKYCGISVDQSFVETLLDDLEDQSDQLPVLQHALMRTWNHWYELNDPDRPMGYAEYDSIGTMRNAMSRHADEAYGELDKRGREICRRMFRAITEKGPDNKGIRRPTVFSSLQSIIDCSPEELAEVIGKFRQPSRSFLTPGPDVDLKDDTVIDLSHESLIRLWDRLAVWVDEEAASIQMYLKLSETSSLYQHGKTGLMRPPDLQMAINWRDQEKPTLKWARRYDPAFERAMVYLRTSEKEYQDEEKRKLRLQKNKIKRSRIFTILFGGATIIALGLMIAALIQKLSADRQKEFAESRQLLAEMDMRRADSAASTAITRWQQSESGAVAARKDAEEALRQKDLIQNRLFVARRNADSALKAFAEADQKIAEVTEGMNSVNRLRMISLGRSLSLRSLQLNGQKDLQTLLAYQAYLFNLNNGGYENDADIFNGLYNVVKQYGEGFKYYNGHQGEIKSIAFRPGTEEFYCSDSEKKILKWTLNGGSNDFREVYSGERVIRILAADPEGSWLAAGEENSSIIMIPLKPGETRYKLSAHLAGINSLNFSADGKHLYSASYDGRVLKWDLNEKTCINITPAQINVHTADISPGGKFIAGITAEGSVTVWNPDDIQEHKWIQSERKNITVVRFRKDDRTLAIGNTEGFVELWDALSGKRLSGTRAHEGRINDIRFNEELNQMATAGNDSCIRIFDISDMAGLSVLPVVFADNGGTVTALAFSNNGQQIVSGIMGREMNLASRPASAGFMVQNICTLVTRNLTEDEWNTWVDRDIPREEACSDIDFSIKIREVK
ncbi:MAG TPA: hypothetical protein PLO24_03585 [Bacteroidales bacterium]|jgi:WD40 repeat protein|nr:hypothetical protein [Bacteroidales bacterium]HOS72493.1 hypothetical protein [Bacteroidales bacterium]HQH24330.1 hypothetical protein [Bacteroidales bacterium]HQJ81565.1 hypothetical protein [Bacteroidales bacterium]